MKKKLHWSIAIGLSAVLGMAQTPHTVPPGGSYIGVMIQEIDGERAKALKLPEDAGVEITVVEPDSPAAKVGLKVGDAVLKYNGQPVEGMEQFARMVRETPAGHEVKLEISRGGATQTVAVRVGQRKAQHMDIVMPMPMNGFEIQMPDFPRGFLPAPASILGVETEAIDGQLAQYFGVKDGVLVRSVVKGSAAEKAGIKAGDVIVRIGDTHVQTPMDISGYLRTVRGKSTQLGLMRDRKEVTLTVAVPEGPGWIQITPFQVTPKQP